VRGEGMMQMVGGMLSGSAVVRLKALEAIQEFAKETDQDRVGERGCNNTVYDTMITSCTILVLTT